MRTYYGCCLDADQENVDDCLCYNSELESVLSLIYRHYDYSFSIGRDAGSDIYYLCERIDNATEKELNGLTVTFFQLEHNKTITSKLNWMEGIYIKTLPEKSNQVKKMSLYDYLMTSAQAKSLVIFRFPQKPLGIPQDDHDLVERAIIQHHMYGPSALTKIASYHPDLYDKVMQGVQAGLYQEYGI